MYVSPNFKSKKALKDAVKAGEPVFVYSVGPFAGSAPSEGKVSVEGPHYPAPHTWYGSVEIKGGKVVKVLG
jgi:hypothetical protein